MLKGKQQWIKQIADMEKSITGTRQKYIPTKAVTNSNVVRKTVHNGDIIAIVTTKAGLEISHIGIAVWWKTIISCKLTCAIKKPRLAFV